MPPSKTFKRIQEEFSKLEKGESDTRFSGVPEDSVLGGFIEMNSSFFKLIGAVGAFSFLLQRLVLDIEKLDREITEEEKEQLRQQLVNIRDAN